jgi:hypothetical protein
MAHCLEESKSVLNWIYACMMLLFAAWSFLVMQQVDLTQIVRMTSDAVTRGDQRYPVELFGIFSWENVKMQLIPWCAYPIRRRHSHWLPRFAPRARDAPGRGCSRLLRRRRISDADGVPGRRVGHRRSSSWCTCSKPIASGNL